eukprot:TRINITY_DN1234_c0_g1_i1.p1 TRINITY_DN1234_c0_g1~~TRINITY_DN1234_c0_g1_i1.p1  ORF type:complete len:186 (+),score=7.34 TRINITY_DN1234_c0_g1_i1:46-603(+)
MAMAPLNHSLIDDMSATRFEDASDHVRDGDVFMSRSASAPTAACQPSHEHACADKGFPRVRSGKDGRVRKRDILLQKLECSIAHLRVVPVRCGKFEATGDCNHGASCNTISSSPRGEWPTRVEELFPSAALSSPGGTRFHCSASIDNSETHQSDRPLLHRAHSHGQGNTLFCPSSERFVKSLPKW